ncbi:MAG: sigma-70 family RNA polymerase sigma factor [Victivallales bacterium]|nr:sigma-70 family RNA polymerase sigma factor [Victivallales bacterium]
MNKNCEIIRIDGIDHKATDLYNEYFPILSRAAAVKRLPRDLCDDVASETLCSFFQNPEKYDSSRATLKTYLCTVAKSRAIDLFRKRKGDRLFCVENDELALLDKRSTIHDSLEGMAKLSSQPPSRRGTTASSLKLGVVTTPGLRSSPSFVAFWRLGGSFAITSIQKPVPFV